MKILPLVLLAAVTLTARADLTLTEQIQQEGAQKIDTTATVKVKSGKIRVDLSPQATAIVDAKTGDVQTLLHSQKMVLTIPGDKIKALQQAALAQSGTGTTTEPKATGNKETISGYPCEEYEMESNGTKMHLWVTQELSESDEVWSDLAGLNGEMDPFKGLLKKTDVPGFPIRTVAESSALGKMTITLVGINRDNLPESDFKVPAGYRAMKMPTIPLQ